MSLRCAICDQPNIEEIVEQNKRYYFCQTCQQKYERVIDSRYGRDRMKSQHGDVVHYSVGALIRDQDKVLLVKRRTWPFTYAFPAGHVEYGESPLEALLREIREELGLTVESAELVFHDEIPGDECRYGANRHIWHFYRCRFATLQPFVNPESESFARFTRDEALKLELNPAAHYLFHNIVTE